MRHRGRRAFTLIELLVTLAVVAVLIGLTVAAVQRVRARAAAAQCMNNLKQIGLALQNYHDSHGAFPPGCLGPKSPQPFMGWMTRLLPYLEQGALWDDALRAFAAAPFFEDTPHRPILGRPMPPFLCPLEDRTTATVGLTAGLTSYQGVSGRSVAVFDGVLYLDSAVRLGDVTDGASLTLAVGERPPSRDGRFGWWYAGWGGDQTGTGDLFLGVRERNLAYDACPLGPNHFIPSTDSDCDAFHFWSRHPGGAHFLFCDGSVRFLAYSADPLMPALATRAGGEAVALPD
jgi:prepilin-type N-terminal cleavage/methylation domain-containing protein/prepilin-type processing-associated H-X9-DG protein